MNGLLKDMSGKYIKMRALWIFFAAWALLIAGCATTAQQACMQEWEKRHKDYTEDQRLALFYGAKDVGCIHEWFFTLDERGVPQIAYQKIKMEKVLKVGEKQLADLDEILNPQNEKWYLLLEETGMRSYLEAQERALKFRVARINIVLNHEKFRKLMGETGFLSEEEKTKRFGYRVDIILPEFNPEQETPFRAKYVEEAKQRGKLKFIGKFILFDYELLGKKETDLEFPRDPKKFVWKEKREGLELDFYKIIGALRPLDKVPSYAEATRVIHRLDDQGNVIDIQRESKPALRIFVSSADKLDIVVLDSDREGELGFGLPDVVEQLMTGITTGKEFYVGHQSLLSRLFEEKTKNKRRFPSLPQEQKFLVAEAGTQVDPWEKSADPNGWTVPFEYISDKKDNYKVEIVFARHGSYHGSSLRKIEAFKKIYLVPGNEWQSVKGDVVEYYRPLPDFSEQDIVEAQVDYANKKKLTIVREGKPSVSGIMTPHKNLFIEEQLYRVDYTEGDARWRFEDRDGTGALTHRMEISKSAGSGGASSSPSDYGY